MLLTAVSRYLSLKGPTVIGFNCCDAGPRQLSLVYTVVLYIYNKMRYSNLSNNMMIIELYCEQQLQFKYSSQARLCSSEAS